MKTSGHPILLDMNPKNYNEEVRRRFNKMEFLHELADLLQFVYEQRIGIGKEKENIRIDVNVLTYYAYVLRNGEGYVDFEIPKKSGGKRKISSPKYTLKLIQQCLLEILSVIYTPHRSAHGFVLRKNVASNASAHVGKKYVFNIDLKDFFPTTSFHKIRFLLTLKPFYLNDKRKEIGQLIANLCCKEGYLPQGSPASPMVTNIVCRRIDARLTQLAKRHKARYTRYADDISFSCNRNIFNDSFLMEISAILADDKYEINDKKTRLSKWYQRQEVTGVVVNEKINLPREYIKDIRYWLFVWGKFGEEKTQEDFERRFPNKKGFNRYKGNSVKFTNYLHGKIQYLKMIRGKDDKMIIRFTEKYNSLDKKNENSNQKKIYRDDSIHGELRNIRTALEIKGDFSIDYTFVKELHWRKQLMADNLKMEHCGIRNIGDDGRFNNPKDAFNGFCMYAIFQIELLLNIYFKKRFPNWSDLVTECKLLEGTKLKQNFKLKAYNNTINSMSLYSKLFLYAVMTSLLQTNTYKGVNAIREIRNIKISHRPAHNDEPAIEPPVQRKSNLGIKGIREILIQESKTAPVRNYLTDFVEHIKKHMPE